MPSSETMEGASVDPEGTSTKATERIETPELISPPTTRTPPTVERERKAEPAVGGQATNRSSTPVDAAELSRKLQHHEEETGRQREHTPGASPSRKRPRRIYGDRSVIVVLRGNLSAAFDEHSE